MRIFYALIAAVTLLAGPALAGQWTPLIGPEKLERLIAEDEPVVLDIRSVKAYGEGHVETAVSVPYHAWRGPKDNPGQLISDEKLTFLLQEAGVERSVPVIVTYQGRDDSDFGAAARVYWTLKSAGVERIAILNGGVEAWARSGRALSTEEWSNFPSDEVFALSDRWAVDHDGVEAVRAGLADMVLIDARPESFFRGAAKHPLVPVAGAFADALNLPHSSFFGGGPVFSAEPEAVRASAEAAGWRPGGPAIVSYCNTGHWAATNWFALSEIAGIEGVKLYPESLTGWTRARGVGALVTTN